MLAKLISKGIADTHNRTRLIYAMLLPGFLDAALTLLIQVGIYDGRNVSLSLFIIFCLLCMLSLSIQNACSRVVATVVESALCEAQGRIVSRLRNADLQAIEVLGRAEIYKRLTHSMSTISRSLWWIALAVHSGVVIICISAYVAIRSPEMLLCLLSIYGIGGAFYARRRGRIRNLMRSVAAEQLGLFAPLNDLLGGAKEVRLRLQRGHEVMSDFEQMALALRAGPASINQQLQKNFVFIRLLQFGLMALLVFLLPLATSVSVRELHLALASGILMFDPLMDLLRAIPEYERAALEAEGLEQLEESLERAASPGAGMRTSLPAAALVQIQAQDLCFTYNDPHGGSSFTLGPLSLTLHAGETVFFVGGNGSGKTTLLKLLAGLYTPSSGQLLWDSRPVGWENLQAYRDNIAAIFADFHLFKKLYGLSDKTAEQVQALLEKLHLSSRTRYSADGFSQINLSTGQRKRLAMVVALLEDRQLYIFDEWAADQDPEFRRYYYEQLLPELKRQGKTVWAISHDDRYFHLADRVVSLEYGAIRSVSSPAHHSASTTAASSS